MKLGLAGEGYSPAVLRKIVRQGGKAPGFAEAAADLADLAGVDIHPTHVRTLTERVGDEWAAARDADVELFKRGGLKRLYADAPAAAAVMLDGGRAQTRASDGSGPGVRGGRWRESKVACCLTLSSRERAADPEPSPPAAFLDRQNVARLAAEMRRRGAPARQRSDAGSGKGGCGKKGKKKKKKKPVERPVRLVRTVIATMQPWEEFGWHVAAEVHRRGLDRAGRKACVCDGSGHNWSVFETHLRPAGFVGVLDFLHLLASLYGAASAAASEAAARWGLYDRWLRLAWAGRTDDLLGELRAESRKAGPPPGDAHDDDPRKVLAAAAGYVEGGRERMDYPRYRRLGLPISSAPVESAIKQINRRVKGTEKFWLEAGAEAVLQVRTAHLSEDDRTDRLWRLPRPHRAAAPSRFRKAS